jgi:hypothetical protein
MGGRNAEQVAEYNHEDVAARRVTELYTKTVEQLGSDKAAVRHGALYALYAPEHVTQDNRSQRQPVVNVLCAYFGRLVKSHRVRDECLDLT